MMQGHPSVPIPVRAPPVPPTDAVPSPPSSPGPPKKATKHTKLKPLKPREILNSDPLFSQAAVEPPLSKENGVGRYVLAPASQWPDLAQVDSGGFIGKMLKVINTSTQVQFTDGKAWFSWEASSQFKPLS